jgi:hypothetical protein
VKVVPILAAVVLVALLAGVAVASGVVSFADPPRPAAVAAQVPAAPAPAAAPAATPTVDLDAARAQLMTDESQMCNCGR